MKRLDAARCWLWLMVTATPWLMSTSPPWVGISLKEDDHSSCNHHSHHCVLCFLMIHCFPWPSDDSAAAAPWFLAMPQSDGFQRVWRSVPLSASMARDSLALTRKQFTRGPKKRSESLLQLNHFWHFYTVLGSKSMHLIYTSC